MAKATYLVFVRHAAVECTVNGQQVLCGRYDAPLSTAGLIEVDCLRQRLAAAPPFRALYSSPLRRAMQTADAAPSPLIGCMRTLNSLAEIDCGRLDGKPIDGIQHRYPELWNRNEEEADEEFSWPGGESYRKFRKRVWRIVSAIATAHPEQRVLIVTHAGVINQVLGSIAGQSAARWKNYRPRTASLTEIVWTDSKADINSFDDCAHIKH